MIKELAKDGIPTLSINTGNMLFPLRQLDPVREKEDKVKAEAFVRASQAMGIRLGGVGPYDLAGTVNFLEQYSAEKDEQGNPLFTWLSANLVHPANKRHLFTQLRLVRVGKLKVAVLALIDPGKTPEWTKGRAYTVLPWREALPGTLPQAEQMAELIILLSNYSYEENMKIAHAFPVIDIILQSGQNSATAPTVVDNTLIANSDRQGKHLAVLDIDWQGKGRWTGGRSTKPPLSTVQQRLIEMNRSMGEDEAVDRIVGRGISEALELRRLGQQNLQPGTK